MWDVQDDAAWAGWKGEWDLRPDTIYLNHGSFGPPPRAVRCARQAWQDALDQQPMDFFLRQFEPAWRQARQRLAEFVGTSAGNLIFVENATTAMNLVAEALPLSEGDEVLLTDHEYGAVQRIWQRACLRQGARLRTAVLPVPCDDPREIVEAVAAAFTEHTRLLVVSHITSPTAIILPVAELAERARRQGIAVAIDGPHALAQVPLALDALGCDFYAASCHKWLSGPFGSGFLYVAPRWQERVRPSVLSWGRLPPGPIECWSDEFLWQGTRNPAAYLAVPAAIAFLEAVGLEAFRARTHALARYARQRMIAWTQLAPLVPDDPRWYASMAHVPLPAPPGEKRSALSAGRASAAGPPSPADPASPAGPRASGLCPVGHPLQAQLWQTLRIEVPVIEFRGQRYLRISCHLYNDHAQIDHLVEGVRRLIERGS
jgi:isopenicillin-N epimerase